MAHWLHAAPHALVLRRQDYVYIAETDHLLLTDIPNRATPKVNVAFFFPYMSPVPYAQPQTHPRSRTQPHARTSADACTSAHVARGRAPRPHARRAPRTSHHDRRPRLWALRPHGAALVSVRDGAPLTAPLIDVTVSARSAEQANVVKRYFDGDHLTVQPVGPSPAIVHVDNLKKLTPLWYKLSVDLKHDTAADRAFGWCVDRPPPLRVHRASLSFWVRALYTHTALYSTRWRAVLVARPSS
jgi:hypothetical protein